MVCRMIRLKRMMMRPILIIFEICIPRKIIESQHISFFFENNHFHCRNTSSSAISHTGQPHLFPVGRLGRYNSALTLWRCATPMFMPMIQSMSPIHGELRLVSIQKWFCSFVKQHLQTVPARNERHCPSLWSNPLLVRRILPYY